MPKKSVEEIKDESRQLRGRIEETLASDAPHFEEAEYQLMKFHGSYQQDDRDQRAERRKQKLDKAWSFMVRTKMPAGAVTAEQYLAHDRIADDLAGHTIRLTTRQGMQMHGILKDGLKETIRRVVDSGLTTWGACGDVVRNTMGPAAPIDDAAHRDAFRLAREINEGFLAKSTAYAEIWLNGERLELEGRTGGGEEVEEPVYGKRYLPRKFKMAIAIPPRNDVDVYSQDVGFVPHLVDGEVEGYTILVGGGFGMSHGMVQTHPILAKPLFYTRRGHTVAAAVAIVGVQRDHGNREDRKQARLKYLIEKKGLEWFRAEVEARLENPVEEAKPVAFETVSDALGWHPQGDGRDFLGVYVSQGRIQDTDGRRLRSCIRAVAERFGFPIRITPNANLIFEGIDPSQREEVEAVLAAHGVTAGEELTKARQVAHACVALPTCGLALAESERVFPALLDRFDEILRDLGLEDEPILFRMTGCPNGCARPYNADFGFVGRSPGKYAMYVGGSSRGDRLAGLEKKSVAFEDIPAAVRASLEEFATNRRAGETFTDYRGRTRENGPDPHPEQFHVEFEEREKARAAQG